MLKVMTIAALISTAGCSWALQDRPRAQVATSSAAKCGTTPWWIGDAVLLAAIVGGGIAAQFVVKDEDNRNLVQGPAMVEAVLATASLGYGVRTWNYCRSTTSVETTASR